MELNKEGIAMANISIISHRGANIYAPQNTLPAFRRGLALGADGFETDVHRTKDGVLVLCHNYSIDKTSNGKGLIAQMTLDALRAYDFGSYFSKKFSGTPIPTLDEFLDLVAESSIRVLNIELKSPKENETTIVPETIDAVKNHGLFDRLLISSFDPALLMEAKRVDPQTRTGFLYSPNSKVTFKIVHRKMLTVAKEIGADALHPFSLYVNKSLVDAAHQAGMEINVWTVNSPKSVLRMADLGVEGLITDYPDVVRGVLEAHGCI